MKASPLSEYELEVYLYYIEGRSMMQQKHKRGHKVFLNRKNFFCKKDLSVHLKKNTL